MSHEGHYRSLRSREIGDKELGLFLSKRKCEAQQPPEVIKSVSGAWLTHGVS